MKTADLMRGRERHRREGLDGVPSSIAYWIGGVEVSTPGYIMRLRGERGWWILNATGPSSRVDYSPDARLGPFPNLRVACATYMLKYRTTL